MFEFSGVYKRCRINGSRVVKRNISEKLEGKKCRGSFVQVVSFSSSNTELGGRSWRQDMKKCQIGGWPIMVQLGTRGVGGGG